MYSTNYYYIDGNGGGGKAMSAAAVLLEFIVISDVNRWIMYAKFLHAAYIHCLQHKNKRIFSQVELTAEPCPYVRVRVIVASQW